MYMYEVRSKIPGLWLWWGLTRFERVWGTKQQSSEWKRTASSRPSKARQVKSATKSMRVVSATITLRIVHCEFTLTAKPWVLTSSALFSGDWEKHSAQTIFTGAMAIGGSSMTTLRLTTHWKLTKGDGDPDQIANGAWRCKNIIKNILFTVL